MGNKDSKFDGNEKKLVLENSFSKKQFKRCWKEMSKLTRLFSQISAYEMNELLKKWNDAMKMKYDEEVTRLNQLLIEHGFPELVKQNVLTKNEGFVKLLENANNRINELEKTAESVNVLKASLKNANDKINELEQNRVLVEKLNESLGEKINSLEKTVAHLESKLPMNPQVVRKMKIEMTELLKSFKKQQEKTIGQNIDDFLKKISRLKKAEKVVVSDYEKRANLYEYILTANIYKIKMSRYVTAADILPIPERPNFSEFRFHSIIPQSNECTICLKEMQEGTDIISFCKTCKMNFHKKCVGGWLNRSKTCPLCRSPEELLDHKQGKN